MTTAEVAAMPDFTIGPLQPGLYVLEFPGPLDVETADAMQRYLKEVAPECRFIFLHDGMFLADGVRIARERVIP
jgi:hypothetical protein